MCLYRVLHKLCVNILLNAGLIIVGEDVLCALIRGIGKCYFFGKLAQITEDV